MVQYVDDCPANKTTVCYRRGRNLYQEITTLLSLKSTLVRSFNLMYSTFDSCVLIFYAYCMIAFIVDVSHTEFTNFSLNTVITFNNKLWIITETIGFLKIRECLVMLNAFQSILLGYVVMMYHYHYSCVLSIRNSLEYSVHKDTVVQQQYLLLSGVTEISESYTERELVLKIVNSEEHWRQLRDCVGGELRHSLLWALISLLRTNILPFGTAPH